MSLGMSEYCTNPSWYDSPELRFAKAFAGAGYPLPAQLALSICALHLHHAGPKAAFPWADDREDESWAAWMREPEGLNHLHFSPEWSAALAHLAWEFDKDGRWSDSVVTDGGNVVIRDVQGDVA